MTDRGILMPQYSDSLASEINNIKSNVTTVSPQLADIAINIKQFGVKGDGLTNDTIAMQNAINAINSSGGGVLFFPKGIYLINATITLYSNMKLISNAAIIKLSESLDIQLFTFSNISNLTIDGLTFDGNSSIINLSINRFDRKAFIYSAPNVGQRSSNIIICNCSFKNTFGRSLQLHRCQDVNIYNNVFDNAGFDSLTILYNCIRLNINNNRFINGYGIAIKLGGRTNESLDTINIKDNIIINMTRDTQILTGDSNLNQHYAIGIEANVEVFRLFCIGNYIDDCKDMGMSVSGVNIGIVSNNHIKDIGKNLVLPLEVGGYGIGVELVRAYSILCNNNIFQNILRDSIVLDKSNNDLIENNKFIGKIYTSNDVYGDNDGKEMVGILFAGTISEPITNILINGNYFEGMLLGIWVGQHASNNTITNNIFLKNGYSINFTIYAIQHNDFDIRGNRFDNIIATPIYLRNFNRFTIQNNIFISNSWYPYALGLCRNASGNNSLLQNNHIIMFNGFIGAETGGKINNSIISENTTNKCVITQTPSILVACTNINNKILN